MDVHGGFIVPKTKVWMIDVSIHEIKVLVFLMLIRHTMTKLSARQNNMMSIYGHGLTAQPAVEPKGRNVYLLLSFTACSYSLSFILC